MKEEARIEAQSEEPILPKLLVVAGDPHSADGPTHNLLDTAATVPGLPVEKSSKDTAQTEKAPKGFWKDFVQDMGIPTSFSMGSASEKTSESSTSGGDDSQAGSRGVLAVLGLLAGSWIIGGIVNN